MTDGLGAGRSCAMVFYEKYYSRPANGVGDEAI